MIIKLPLHFNESISFSIASEYYANCLTIFIYDCVVINFDVVVKLSPANVGAQKVLA